MLRNATIRNDQGRTHLIFRTRYTIINSRCDLAAFKVLDVIRDNISNVEGWVGGAYVTTSCDLTVGPPIRRVVYLNPEMLNLSYPLLNLQYLDRYAPLLDEQMNIRNAHTVNGETTLELKGGWTTQLTSLGRSSRQRIYMMAHICSELHNWTGVRSLVLLNNMGYSCVDVGIIKKILWTFPLMQVISARIGPLGRNLPEATIIDLV